MATNLASSAVTAGDDATAAQYNNLRTDVIKNAGDFEVTAGTGTALTLAVDSAISAYSEGDKFRMQLHTDVTGACTLNVNSIGAKTIKKNHDQDLAPNDLLTNQIVEVVYQADDDIFELISPVAVSPGEKITIDLTGATFSTTTAEQTLTSVTVTGGTLGSNNGIHVLIPITNWDCINAGTTGCTFRLKYGSTTVATAQIGENESTGPTGLTGKIEAFLLAGGSTSSQEGSLMVNIFGIQSTQPSNTTDSIGDVASGTAAEDSTGDLTLSVTAQFAVSSGSNGMTVPHGIFTKIR